MTNGDSLKTDGALLRAGLCALLAAYALYLVALISPVVAVAAVVAFALTELLWFSKGDTFENDFVKLIFNATAIANIADNAASAPLTDLRVSLHTADVGEAGTQTTNETVYTNYTRILVARASGAGGWTVTGNAVENASAITFPACGVTGATISHFGIGTATSGAGKVLYKGVLGSSLAVSDGVTPEFAPGALDVTED